MKGLIVILACLAHPLVSSSAVEKIIIAHRGASGYLPEHTLEAKAVAHAMGADFVEQDLVLSKDGVPVVLHDIYLDTVTDVAKRFSDRKRPDGRYYAIDFTLAELKSLRVTERFDPKTGRAIYEGRFPVGQSSFTIATMEEELQLIQGLNKSSGREVGIYPEIKSPSWHRDEEHQDISAKVLQILSRYGYKSKTDKCWVQCFEFAELKRIRQELGFKGKLLLLFDDDPAAENDFLRTRLGLAEVVKVADGIGPSLTHIVTGRTNGKLRFTTLVSDAHASKLLVHPYTFRADEVPQYASSLEDLFRIFLVEAGVDGVFTDFPDRARAFVRSVNSTAPKK